MSNIAIIPARGGSKRIPKKNIKGFLGKPVIAYSIEAALLSGLFEEVMVSTDDEEIAAVAKQYGATVPFMRSQKNADDFATLNDVIEEVLGSYNNEGKKFNNGCCILSTAPFVTTEKLKEAYNLLLQKKFDSVRPIVKFSYPIQRAFKLSPNNSLQMFYPEHLKTRSQDLEPAYHDAGQFYWFRTDKILTGTNKGGLIISETEAQDIDTIEDWELAELKLSMLRNLFREG
ncbi:pseudaminic acid cytidylyltransferase [Parafilimonas terrae]|uniref:N-acylneuraminate cytidylyltransferase n=1 Tax=Parafilimonas terrae TaxID=1465490 RepID=A0A1I5X386_9BACT|nr:pseudaminic acid cytidylyltransferase [Parafilimonas terrae]SFQ26443.1 N-acylneuraminate cytidylyltransferase [Parafilimonas terrae]